MVNCDDVPMAELIHVLTFVVADGTLAPTAALIMFLIVTWTFAVTCCVRIITCVERATHCHHHDDVHGVPRRMREVLFDECKDFSLRVARSNASGERVTRRVALQHAFDAFGGSNTGLIKDAKADVRPDMWALGMRSLAIDVFIEQNRERAMLFARCAELLDSVCQVSESGSDDSCGDDCSHIAWQEDGTEQEEVANTLLHLVSWSNCGCLRRHVCAECGASDFSWVGHPLDKMAEHASSVGGHCTRILPPSTDTKDDDLSPRYCDACRETIGPVNHEGSDDEATSARLKSKGD